MSQRAKTRESLTLMIALADQPARRVVESMVATIGHHLSFSTDSASELIDRCEQRPPDLAIVHHQLVDGTGLDVVNHLGQRGATAAILLVELSQLELAQTDTRNPLAGLLITPLSVDQLRSSIFIARRRFELAVQLTDRARDLQQQLHDDPVADSDSVDHHNKDS